MSDAGLQRPCIEAPSSPEDLARRAREGSAEAFEALVALTGPRLLRFLRARTCDEHVAEDLLQETFLKAYAALDRYDPSRSFRAWIYTIASRLAISHARSPRSARAVASRDRADVRQADPAESAQRREQHGRVWDCAARVLTGNQFDALWLRYGEDLDVADIARAMGKTRVHVKVLLHRAHRRLMDRLAGGPAASPARPPAPAGAVAWAMQDSGGVT